MNNIVTISLWLVVYCAVFRIQLLNWCAGKLGSCKRAYITALAVSEETENKGVYSHNHICRQLVGAMLICSIYLFGLKYSIMYPKSHASCLFNCGCQKLLSTSSLEKRYVWLGL